MVLLLLWHIWYDDKFMDRFSASSFWYVLCHLPSVICRMLSLNGFGKQVQNCLLKTYFARYRHQHFQHTHTYKKVTVVLIIFVTVWYTMYVYGCDPFFDVRSTKNHRHFCLHLPEYSMNPLSGDILTKNVSIKKKKYSSIIIFECFFFFAFVNREAFVTFCHRLRLWL